MGKETDVYSWGVLLWEMSSGARAWANLRFAQVGPEGCLVHANACSAMLMVLVHAEMGSRGWLGARRRLLCCADGLVHAQMGSRELA